MFTLRPFELLSKKKGPKVYFEHVFSGYVEHWFWDVEIPLVFFFVKILGLTELSLNFSNFDDPKKCEKIENSRILFLTKYHPGLQKKACETALYHPFRIWSNNSVNKQMIFLKELLSPIP